MTVTVYRDRAGRWRWKAKAANGRVTGASEQGYRSRWYTKLKARRANPGADVEVA